MEGHRSPLNLALQPTLPYRPDSAPHGSFRGRSGPRMNTTRSVTRFRIMQTSSSTYWYIVTPLSFLSRPVQQSVQGEVEETGAGE